MPFAEVLTKRKTHIGPNTTLNYKQPLHIVRGEGCHLYDADGVEYLDCVNNVAHVGHCNPTVRYAPSRSGSLGISSSLQVYPKWISAYRTSPSYDAAPQKTNVPASQALAWSSRSQVMSKQLKHRAGCGGHFQAVGNPQHKFEVPS